MNMNNCKLLETGKTQMYGMTHGCDLKKETDDEICRACIEFATKRQQEFFDLIHAGGHHDK